MSDHVGGSTIGSRYFVIHSLMGGMGIVYLCLDTGREGLPVAKPSARNSWRTVKRGNGSSGRASLWVELGFHPNIVQAYRVEQFPNDVRVYIVLQLIPTPSGWADPSLRSRLIEGPAFTHREALNTALGVVRGMKFATVRFPGLIHRDLKPENILLGPDGEPRITDFGLASVSPVNTPVSAGISASHNEQFTTSGTGGTPLYMSPEQWRGEPLDTRTDIYSFGCILFELFEKEFLVNGPDPIALARAHCLGEGIRRLNKTKLTGNLARIIKKCVEPDRTLRYPAWEDVEKDIAAEYQSLLQIAPPAEWSGYDVSKQQQIQLAESYLAIGSAYLNLAQFDRGIQYLQKAQAIAEREGSVLVQALAVADEGVGYADQGRFQEAIPCYHRAIGLFKIVGDTSHAYLHVGNLGNAYFGLYDLGNGEKYIRAALEYALQAGDRAAEAVWRGNLANLYAAKGDFSKSLAFFEMARNLSSELGDRISECKHLAGIGLAFEGLGDFAKAAEHYQKGLLLAQRIGDRQGEGTLHLSLGNLSAKRNQLGEAAIHLSNALSIGKEISDQHLTMKALGNLATAYLLLSQPPQALPLLEESIRLSKQIGAKDVTARANWSLGLLYEMMGKYLKSIAYLREGVLGFKELRMPEYHPASDHLRELRKQLGLV